MLVFPLAQAFRECVKTRVRTQSGSDGILTIPRNLMIRSLPLAVLTRTLNAWASRKPSRSLGCYSMSFLLRRFRFRYWSALMKHRQPLAVTIGPDGRVTCLIRIHLWDLHRVSNQLSVIIELHR